MARPLPEELTAYFSWSAKDKTYVIKPLFTSSFTWADGESDGSDVVRELKPSKNNSWSLRNNTNTKDNFFLTVSTEELLDRLKVGIYHPMYPSSS